MDTSADVFGEGFRSDRHEIAERSDAFLGSLANRVVGGKYRIDAYLASGSVGVVYSADHVELGERVALKFLSSQWTNDAVVVERFLAEARTQFRIGSDHVTRVLDVGTTEWGTSYFVMELVDGSSLRDLVNRLGRLDPAHAAEIARQGSLGLGAAHALGVVHRDVKGGNMMLFDRGGRACVKVLDFGLADVRSVIQDRVRARRLTPSSAVMGTPLYMAPEQLRGARRATIRSDIWSMGIVLYELMTGEKPYTLAQLLQYVHAGTLPSPTRPDAIRREIPRGLAEIVAKCLAFDPEARYQDGAELARALEPFAEPFCLAELEQEPEVAAPKPRGPLTFARTRFARPDGTTAFSMDELVDLGSPAPRAIATEGDATELDRSPSAWEATDPVVIPSSRAPLDARRSRRRRLGLAGLAAALTVSVAVAVALSGTEATLPDARGGRGAVASSPVASSTVMAALAPAAPETAPDEVTIELDDVEPSVATSDTDASEAATPPHAKKRRRRSKPSSTATASSAAPPPSGPAAPAPRSFSPYVDRW